MGCALCEICAFLSCDDFNWVPFTIDLSNNQFTFFLSLDDSPELEEQRSKLFDKHLY